MKLSIRLFSLLLLLLTTQTIVAQDESMKTYSGHTHRINALDISPDGKFIASASADYTLKLWNIETGKDTITFRGHTDNVRAVCFSPDGRYLLSGGDDKTIRMWDISTGKNTKVFTEKKSTATSLAFNPDGYSFVSGHYDNTVCLWKTLNGKLEKVFKGHEWTITSLDYSADGKNIVSVSGAGKLILWKSPSGQIVKSVQAHKGWATSVHFSADDMYIVTSGEDKNAIRWDTQLRKIRKFECNTEVNSACFSSDGKYIATAGNNKEIQLWDVNTGNSIHKFKGHSVPATTLEFTPDGKNIISAGNDKVLKSWDIVNLVVYTYYARQIKQDLTKLNYNAPKGEFETKAQYQARLSKSDDKKKDLYKKYRTKYNNMLNQKEVDRQNKIKNSLRKINIRLQKLGYYNAEEQYFPITILGKTEKIKIPIEDAPSFKKYKNGVSVTAQKQLMEDGKIYDIFNIKIKHPRKAAYYKFGKQKTPLYHQKEKPKKIEDKTKKIK